MPVLDVTDVESMIRILATAADPLIEMPAADRKRAIMEQVAALLGADVWIWLTAKQNLQKAGDAMAISMVDGGWADERERAEVFRVIIHPELQPTVTAPMHHAVLENRSLTYSRRELMSDDDWNSSRTGQIWRTTGFDHFVLSVYPVGEGLHSGIGFHRRLGKPAFTERDQTVVHVMFQQIDWLHRHGSSVPASEKVVELSPRERQVMLLLLGGVTRKQVAAALKLSEHTVADYLKVIYRKLGVCNRTELLAKFIPQ